MRRLLEIEEALGAAEVARIVGVDLHTAERKAQRVEKLQRIWKQLRELYTPENASKWLHSSVPALGDRRPLDVMTEDGGLDRVLDTVARMSWGIPV